MKYKINGRKFNSKKQIIEYFRKILYRNEGKILDQEDTDDVLELLTYHKDYEKKVGSGIDYIKVEYHIDNLYKVKVRHPHFELYRTDGTNIDFSFIKTISWIKNQKSLDNQHIKDVKASMRFVIKDQIKNFKDKLFQNKKYHKCPILNINYSKATSHIDHEPPLSFDRMIYNFLTEKNLKFKDIELVDVNGIYTTLSDKKLRNEWYNYHKDNACLRGTHRAGNMSQSREKIDWRQITN